VHLAVVGSRAFTNQEVVFYFLEAYHQVFGDNLTIVSGGCPSGPDHFAELFAKQNNVPIILYPADWDIHGKAAGFIRNSDIVNRCDEVIAFWDRKSNGTRDTIRKAEKQNKEVIIVDTSLTIE
jgi:hypothetical protein